MYRITALVLFCFLACGCRCRSDLEVADGQETGVVSGEAAVSRWCRACALKNFLACKRVSGVGSEEDIKRQAQLAACRDVGYSPEECTPDKMRFVECGIETSQK